MKKILLIANTDWYLYRFRSALANFLREQNNEVIFVSPPGPYVRHIQEQNFRWIAWQVGRQGINPFVEFKAILELTKIFSREEPNLVHLHTIKPVIYGSLAAQLTRFTCVVNSITGRGYVFLGKDLKARLLKALIKRIYHLAFKYPNSITIFENETDQNYFLNENLIQLKNSSVIEGVGVDTDYYIPSPEPDSIVTVVLAGRMLWDKGVGTFVEAARSILRLNIPARFILVGEPDSGNPASIAVSTLNQWVKESVVEWWGWQADMRSVFASCHIVVLPSLGEGIPTILLEAAASGRPIIATDVPGCKNVVVHGSTGLLVPKQDASALAIAMEKLIMDKDLRQNLGKEGRKYTIQKFSNAKINQETYEIYKNLW